MAYHIRIGIVTYNDVVAPALDSLNEVIGHLYRAHLRFKVICGDMGRRHQDAILPLKGLFPTSIKEEGDMGIFLGLGNAQLMHTKLRDEIAKNILQALGGRENVTSVEGCITRLRLFVEDSERVDEGRLKELGASGVVKRGKIVQVVMGTQSDRIAGRIKKEL